MMTLPVSTTPFLHQALVQVLGQAAGIKSQAEEANATLLAGPVSSDWIFNFLNNTSAALFNFNRFKNVVGLDTYAQEQVPGYSGSMLSDINAVIDAVQACIDWVVTNFPKNTAGDYILAYTALAADGSKTPRMFSTAQTAGLRTNLQAVIALIG